MRGDGAAGPARRRGPDGRATAARPGLVAAVCAAGAVTVLDGFDAFSMSLAAPAAIRDLGIPTAALGAIFASTMGGMIAGAFGGGVLADTLGRLRVLLIALALFGAAALAMPFAASKGAIIANRIVAGVGLGAAAPIAVALLNGAGRRPPSDLAVALVWAGLAVGGILAAAFNYLVVPGAGWRALFVAGGVLPIPVAIAAALVFRGGSAAPAAGEGRRAPRVAVLFTGGRAARSAGTLLMFFFGYVTTSVIVNWLPTVLAHGRASPATIAIAFGAINVGGAVCTFALGFVSTRFPFRLTLAIAWAVAGLCAAAAAAPGLGVTGTAVLAVAGATAAAATQGLSVAFANRVHRGHGLETTAVGLMISGGRVGQFCALGLSGVVLGLGLPERGLFAFAGGSAGLAALIAAMLVRREDCVALPVPAPRGRDGADEARPLA